MTSDPVRLGVAGLGRAFMLMLPTFRADPRVRLVAAFVALCLLAYQVVLVLALRTSWSFDILLALVLARYCGISADRMTGKVDAFLP